MTTDFEPGAQLATRPGAPTSDRRPYDTRAPGSTALTIVIRARSDNAGRSAIAFRTAALR